MAAPSRASDAADGPVARTVVIPADHPVFAGHYPGLPLVPGVLLAGLVHDLVTGSQLVAAGDRGRIERMRWRSPVRPGDELRVVLTPSDTGDGGVRVAVSIAGAAGTVATAVLGYGGTS